MKKGLFLTTVILTTLTTIVLAQSRIIPEPINGRIPTVTLKYQRISTDINNQMARTQIEQVFYNNFHRDIEGTYIFAIPSGASVTNFAMYMNGRKVTGGDA